MQVECTLAYFNCSNKAGLVSLTRYLTHFKFSFLSLTLLGKADIFFTNHWFGQMQHPNQYQITKLSYEDF
jgi:hypothetical protein